MLFIVFAAEALPVLAPAQPQEVMSWREWALTLGTGLVVFILHKVSAWFADFTGTKAQNYVHEKVTELGKKINETNLGSQLRADDAILNILEENIVFIINDLSMEVRKDLEDGKFDTVDWSKMAARLWDHSKTQITGGVSDYLKASSWQDGNVVAQFVLKKYFNKLNAGK